MDHSPEDELQFSHQPPLQNDTDSDNKYVLSTEDWIAFVGLWLVTLFTIAGNTLVILSFIRDRNLRKKPSNLFLLGLAITDLITGLVSLPLDNMWRYKGEWPYGRSVCIFWTFLDYTVTIQSAYIISLISADRYFLVTKGLRYKVFQTHRRVLIQLIGTLSISFVFHLVAILWFEGTGKENVDFEEECELNALGALSYVIIAVIVEFILPLLIVCFFNLVIYLHILRRLQHPVNQNASDDVALMPSNRGLIGTPAKQTEKNVNQTITSEMATVEFDSSYKSSNCTTEENVKSYQIQPKHASSSANSGSPSNSTSKNQKSSVRKSRKKAATTLSILIVAFIVCWLPYNVVAIIRHISSDLVNVRTWDMVNYLLWFNSAVNPVLYATTNVHFRRNFSELLGKLCTPFKRILCMK
ncbi:muscarinic acetylcholine receptor M4-like [Anneissia japonica]|uniref:muscarinic acetylcholine receptor M4-like n=1 Tax=Anneissia japonica TaxID=1529436 RepID=UPI0014258FCA|nr:muscarinic acetylcholine receptor M4-like [Anneissia japonica]